MGLGGDEKNHGNTGELVVLDGCLDPFQVV